MSQTKIFICKCRCVFDLIWFALLLKLLFALTIFAPNAECSVSILFLIFMFITCRCPLFIEVLTAATSPMMKKLEFAPSKENLIGACYCLIFLCIRKLDTMYYYCNVPSLAVLRNILHL